MDPLFVLYLTFTPFIYQDIHIFIILYFYCILLRLVYLISRLMSTALTARNSVVTTSNVDLYFCSTLVSSTLPDGLSIIFIYFLEIVLLFDNLMFYNKRQELTSYSQQKQMLVTQLLHHSMQCQSISPQIKLNPFPKSSGSSEDSAYLQCLLNKSTTDKLPADTDSHLSTSQK